MVSFGPLTGGTFPFQMGVLWFVNGGDPNHLLNGMILQVAPPPKNPHIHLWVICDLSNVWTHTVDGRNPKQPPGMVKTL